MPAQKIPLLFILVAFASTWIVPQKTFAMGAESPYAVSNSANSGLAGAIQWLVTNESSAGFLGPGLYDEHWTAAGAYALWLNGSHSVQAARSYSWLAKELNDSSHWFWGSYGEADVAGVSLYSIAATGNLKLLHVSAVTSSLLQLQQSNGGFLGYIGSSTNTSSVDTAEALRGLVKAKAINATAQQLAINYLFTLQNPNGSFNLTSIRGYDNLYSQGPEPVSITALTLLALKDASYTASNSHVSKALSFLDAALSKSFTVLGNDTTPVYSASLSALALDTYGQNSGAMTAIAFILSHQNSDGGFLDSTRGSTGSNALDTAWAAIALQEVHPIPAFAPFLQPVVFTLVLVGIVALTVIVGIVAYLVRKNKTQTPSTSL